MIPIPVLGKRWRVSDLFKRREGAWFEPRSGYMWQENTGATATTTGGQTVGKLVDLTAARVASQATAANRPIYGVRRNLLTDSEDFSNGAWIKDAVTVTANAALAPNGTQTADVLIPSVVNAYHGLYYQGVPNSGVNGGYTLYAKASGYNKIRVWNGANASYAVDIDLQTAQIINTGGSVVSATATLLDNGWVEIKLTELISVYFFINVLREADGAYAQFEGDGVSGIYVWGADLRYTKDIFSYPLYQRITTATDYDPGPYPALAHDSTDSLSVALPYLGVGVFSSSGSVYFGVPQGMSALHNQSIGTNYTLPAVNSEIYGWVVVPERLTRPEEAQLERYFLKRAGISGGPDYLLDDNDQQLTDDAGELLLRA